MVFLKKGLDNQVLHLGRKRTDGPSLFDVNGHRPGHTLTYDCSIQFVQLRQRRGINFAADVSLQNLSHQVCGGSLCLFVEARYPVTEAMEDLFPDFEATAINCLVHNSDEKVIRQQS